MTERQIRHFLLSTMRLFKNLATNEKDYFRLTVFITVPLLPHSPLLESFCVFEDKFVELMSQDTI